MTTQESNEARTLADVLATLQVTEAIGHANLTLAPLQGGGRQRFNYALLASGDLAITEVNAAGHVPELLAVNSGPMMILLLDGEELVSVTPLAHHICEPRLGPSSGHERGKDKRCQKRLA